MPDVVLVNPSYVTPPLGPADLAALRSDPLFMDLPSEEFLYPPIGLMTMAGALKRAGFSVEVIDCNVRGWTLDELATRCEGARVVGISLLVANLRTVYRMVRAMRGRGYEVVVGGAYPSTEPRVVSWLGLRYGISGEGEVAFTRLCAALIRGEGRPEDIPGIIVAEEGEEEVWTRPAELLDDLDPYLPDRSSLRAPQYRLPFTGPIEVALASRGCPYKCPFCYCSSPSPASMFNRSRWVDVDVIVGDIRDAVARYRPSYLEMIDETFTVNRGYVEDFCRGLIDAGVRVPWGAKTRVDLVDEDLLARMAEAGLQKIGFGLESGVYDHRRAMTKDFSNERVAEVYAAARRLGIETACTIIFGHPDETLEDMQASIDMVKEIRADYVEFHIMVLVPGTRLFERAVREGKVDRDVFRRFMLGEVTYPEYAPGDLTPEQMRAVHRSALRQFYFRPGYALQALRRLRRPAQFLAAMRAARSLLKTASADQPIWRVGRTAI